MSRLAGPWQRREMTELIYRAVEIAEVVFEMKGLFAGGCVCAESVEVGEAGGSTDVGFKGLEAYGCSGGQGLSDCSGVILFIRQLVFFEVVLAFFALADAGCFCQKKVFTEPLSEGWFRLDVSNCRAQCIP